MALTSIILALIGKFLPYICLIAYLFNTHHFSSDDYGNIPAKNVLQVLYAFGGIMFILAIVFGSVSLGKAIKRGQAIELPLTGLILGIIFLFNLIPLVEAHYISP